MRNDEGLAAAVLAIVMGGAVALAITADIAAPACSAAKAQIGGAKDFDFGCLEYWFNRYQSLLGNLLTAAVAVYALTWAARQWAESSRMSAATVRDILERKIRTYAEEITAVRELLEAISELNLKIGALPLDSLRSQALIAHSQGLGSTWQQFKPPLEALGRSSSSEPHKAQRTKRRGDLDAAANNLEFDAATLGSKLYRSFTTGDVPIEDLAKRIERVLNGIDGIRRLARSHIADLEHETGELWARIHRLEVSVLGDD